MIFFWEKVGLLSKMKITPTKLLVMFLRNLGDEVFKLKEGMKLIPEG